MGRYRISIEHKLDALMRQRAGQRGISANSFLCLLIERGLLFEPMQASVSDRRDRVVLYETRNLIKQLVEARDSNAAKAARIVAEREVGS
ncbi:hypothetical protein [Candidatus Nitrospira nitrificans]|uniref:Uncharacterized protein n=1 Tax=Candidatus Nitrospira nitrificans TaxID=1742973 RepID=A0A0S4LF23_9BACT|nr:hypothetical protein [Candidatus Nitrospira nitrificans]CUS34523.1 hypothetical protein COMA2_170052 [Candidatus Nitrospira nitrificans]